MRRSGEHHRSLDGDSATSGADSRSDWATLRRLFPYLWQYKWRVMAALMFMVSAKMANVSVPLLLKQLVDTMNPKAAAGIGALLVVPIALLFAYGLLRLSTTVFTELRELIFAKATEGASRTISLQVFRHLHALSLRFHLERQTGGMTRDIERGTRAVNSLISFSLYSIFPTLIDGTPQAFKIDDVLLDAQLEQADQSFRLKLSTPLAGNMSTQQFDLSNLDIAMSATGDKLPNKSISSTMKGNVQLNTKKQIVQANLSGGLLQSRFRQVRCEWFCSAGYPFRCGCGSTRCRSIFAQEDS